MRDELKPKTQNTRPKILNPKKETRHKVQGTDNWE